MFGEREESPHDAVDESSDPLIGQTFGSYTIRRRLGRGGMAVIYAAYQPSMEREVAIKVVHPQLLSGDPTFLKRFEREARTIAALEHVHILPVIDYGDAKGRPYLVMRLLPTNLEAYTAANAPLSLQEAADLLNQIASALDHAHAHGVIHRDMKPENVLMDDQGNCFLADFGISRLLDDSAASLTGTDNFIGTPEYVAPEQIMGRAVTPASDVYALGLILYEMICGEMIFHGETPFSIINHHLNTPPAIPPEKRPDLPPIARDVVLKALAKDPADRYASAGEMADAFSQAIRDQAVAPTEKSTLPPRPAPPQEKNVRPITLLPVIVAAVLITAVIALLVFSGGEDPAFYKQAAQTAAAQDDGESAIQYWRAFLELQPDDAGARHSLAERLNLRGLQALQALDYDAALADFQEAVEYAPDYASPHFNMGIVYEEQRQFEEAQVAYEAALAANDQFLMARYRLGEMLLDRGEEESTAEQVERGFDVIDIGINMLNKGDLASEIEDKIRERYTFLLYTARGRAYYLRGGKGNFQLAESDLKRALAYQSAVERPAEAYYYLALLYESQGKAGDAREMWLNVIRYHDPDNNREREWRAEAQEVMSDKDE